MRGYTRTVLLTIKGVTQSMAAWSRQPGAAKYHTIVDRVLRLNWDHERAVFESDQRGKRERISRAVLFKRPKVQLAPNPHRANPFPPCLGGYRSWPIEALEILRRVA